MKHKANADPNLVNKYAKKRIIENTEKDDNIQSKSQKTNKISNTINKKTNILFIFFQNI